MAFLFSIKKFFLSYIYVCIERLFAISLADKLGQVHMINTFKINHGVHFS